MTTNPMTVPVVPPAVPPVRLLRRSSDRLISGTAAGVAAFLGAPAWVVRVLFVLAVMMGGWGLPLYLVLWLIVPKVGEDRGVLDRWLRR